jgi:hypothetical protein
MRTAQWHLRLTRRYYRSGAVGGSTARKRRRTQDAIRRTIARSASVERISNKTQKTKQKDLNNEQI